MLDNINAIMIVVVTLVSFLVHVYSTMNYKHFEDTSYLDLTLSVRYLTIFIGIYVFTFTHLLKPF